MVEEAFNVLGVIMARGGSVGLASKHLRDLHGQAVIDYTFDHALAADAIDRVVVSSDCPTILDVARRRMFETIHRPEALATSDASVQDVLLHAVDSVESRGSFHAHAVVILYGNVPVRPDGCIDAAIAKLRETGCDSVRTWCPVGKWHPYWMATLDGDRVVPNVAGSIHRRQDLPPMRLHDGGCVVVKREALLAGRGTGDPHAMFGVDRRGIETGEGQVIEVDAERDLWIAEAALRREGVEQATEGGVMKIGPREVGTGQPTLVIAEIGVNHDGNVERALQLVGAAKHGGADAVKLQLFRADRLAGDAPLAAYQTGAGGQRDLLRSLELSPAEVERVVEAIRIAGLIPLATPFSPEDVDDVRRLGLPAVKIASPDCVNTLLLRACGALGVPMLVSTGAATPAEIDALCDDLVDCELGLLHCVSSYPTPDASAQLGWIAPLRSRCEIVGYSDHTQNAFTGALAVATGACVIEKHLTYDRSAAGPDHAASFAPAQFAEYVARIRAAEVLVGGGAKTVQVCEQDVRRVSRQSLALRHGIAAGRVIGESDLTTRRPGDGLPPAAWTDVVGKRAARDLPAGTLLQWDLLTRAA